MRFCNKFRLLGGLCLVALILTALSGCGWLDDLLNDNVSVCPSDSRERLGKLLASIPSFAIIGQEDVGTQQDIGDPGQSSLFNYGSLAGAIPPFDLAFPTFNEPSENTIITINESEELSEGIALYGVIKNSDGPVSIYVSKNNDVSGFMVSNQGLEDEEWLVLEPIKYMLAPILNAPNKDEIISSLDMGCSARDFEGLWNAFSDKHIVYDAHQTDFSITLGMSAAGDNADDSAFPATISPQNTHIPPAQPEVYAFADQAFVSLFANTGLSWSEAIEMLLVMVKRFYQEAGIELLIQTPMETEVDISALPDTNNDGKSNLADLNAVSVMCQFAQNYPAAPSVPHRSVEPPATQNRPMVVHLFSGFDFKAVEDKTVLSDSGCCLCTEDCSLKGDIIGLAEGLGGVWHTVSDSCHQMAVDKADSSIRDEDMGPYDGGHHSLSQHRANPNNPRFGATDNYHATLYQRFVLVAHEIGHTLSLPHHDFRAESIMDRQLLSKPGNYSLLYRLGDTSGVGPHQQQKMKNCLIRDKRIRLQQAPNCIKGIIER